MEMHQIRYFLAVAQELNFTHAAEACHVSQPSLSQAIRKLEDELGGALFRRERNHTHLTDLGLKMVPLLTRCYESAMAAREAARALGGGVVAPLRLALSQTIDIDLLLPALDELVRAMPGLELKFTRGDAQGLLQLLKAGGCELAVAGRLDAQWDRLDSWTLFSEGFQLVLPRQHPLAAQNRLRLEDVRQQRVFARPHCENAGDFTALLSGAGVSTGSADEIGSDRDMLSLVEAGLGAGIVPGSATIGANLKAVPLEDLAVQRDVRLYAVAGRPRSAAAAALVTLLRAADWSHLQR